MKKIVPRVVLSGIVLGFAVQLAGQSGSKPAAGSNPKVRAITAFVRLDRASYEKQIAEALVVLRKAKSEFESAGYQVETVRLTTQPLAELVAGMTEEQGLEFSDSPGPVLGERGLPAECGSGDDE